MSTSTQKCFSYEEVAAAIFNTVKSELGLACVEGKQHVVGQSGVTWELDAKGVKEADGSIVVVECKNYSKSSGPIKQEQMGGLAFRIIDLQGHSGIFVTTIGYQAGAQTLANAKDIVMAVLTPQSTPESFHLEFIGKLAMRAVPFYTCGGEPKSVSPDQE